MTKTLLIGNGFNRIDSDLVEWDKLIQYPLQYYGIDGYVDIKKMSYPLKFEYIVNFINENKEIRRNHADLYLDVKKLIIDKITEATDDKMICPEIREALKRIHPKYIITTNYDTQLEKVFASKGKNYQYSKKLIDKMENARNDEQDLILGKTTTLSNVEFYHMHGINVVPRTVCLGYEHYMRIIAKLRSKCKCDSKDNRLIESLKGQYYKSINPSYMARFFDSDVHIIGLGLNEEEVDLWWILCYRAYLYFSNLSGVREYINNEIVYYDIHTPKITNDGYSYEKDYTDQKKALFEYMHIRYESIEVKQGNFKSAYLEALDRIERK